MSLLMEPRVSRALELLRAGAPVLVYDGDDREGETDLFFAAERVGPASVHALRRDAGGLVFLAVDAPVARRFQLPFVQDVFGHGEGNFPALRALRSGKLPYDARSSFSLAINHRKTFTGITDEDRALTIRRFAELAIEARAMRPEAALEALGEEFRTPGHVALCVASEPLLVARRGHTELGAALARMGGLSGVLAGAEMLAAGSALPPRDAAAWARTNETMLLTGDEIAAAWTTFINPRALGPT